MKEPWEWDEDDLLWLITSKEQESLQLEYKDSAALDRKDNKKKAELSKDVSAMANSAGGTIVYGIPEDADHLPTALDGHCDPNEIPKEWLEQIINSTIQRRIDDIRINQVRLNKTHPGKVAYVIQIPQSRRAPHQAPDKKFYRRFNFQAVPMEEYEIRDVARRNEAPALEFIIRRIDDDRLVISLANRGNVSAKNPYVIFCLPNDISQSRYELDGNTRLNSWAMVDEYKGQKGRYMSFRGGSDLVVHPDSEVALLRLEHSRVERRGMMTTVTWGFKYHVYAENMPPVEGLFQVKVEA